MTKGIRINDKVTSKGGNAQIVSPKDILKYISYGHNLSWAILELEATGNLGEEKWIQLEQYKEASNKITKISWEDLVETSTQFRQVIWFTVIGCKDEKKLKSYQDDVEMYESCDIIIEIIDGGCCEVFSKDHSLINKLAKEFKDTEFLTSDWNVKKASD